MKRYLSNFDLKFIAIIAMTIDHFGIVFKPSFYNLFRIIGRISFPIFAFLLVEGYLHTKSLEKYVLRLIVLAVISEVIYDYVLYGNAFYFNSNNIFFTLILGIFTIYFLDHSKKTINKYIKEKIDLDIVLFINYILIIIIMGLIATICNFSYGMFGIFAISFFYLFRNNFFVLTLSLLVISLLYGNLLQLFSLFSLPFIFFYNKNKGVNIKYFFYFYYPLHLLLLGIIKNLIG